ncbi:MAG: helix-turn-helix domain-containing protein [Paraprevotella sp.]|nr:helix-turn-helix domain-containing protein [Paraprevotella sp.]
MDAFTLDTLTDLPLFQGIGKGELAQIATSVPHHVMNYAQGEKLAIQNHPCKQLMVVFRGTVQMYTLSDNNRFAFYERLQSPIALQPEALYGITPHYTHTFTAQTDDVRALVIPKEGVVRLFNEFGVFRLNMINLLSTHIYRHGRWLWHNLSGDAEKRIVNFIHMHSSYPAGEKILEISMEDLGRQINEPRMNVSQALNALQKENLLLLKRRRIIIPALEKLIRARQ